MRATAAWARLKLAGCSRVTGIAFTAHTIGTHTMTRAAAITCGYLAVDTAVTWLAEADAL